jgi:hypothetical protein
MKKYNLFNLSITIKITLAALFLALAVILQKVAAVNYIPVRFMTMVHWFAISFLSKKVMALLVCMIR